MKTQNQFADSKLWKLLRVWRDWDDVVGNRAAVETLKNIAAGKRALNQSGVTLW